jgi:hypothetical protein
MSGGARRSILRRERALTDRGAPQARVGRTARIAIEPLALDRSISQWPHDLMW